MASWFTSLRLFLLKTWFIALLTLTLVVNPVRFLQFWGWAPAGYTLPFSPMSFRALFGAVLVIALFVWFHRQRVGYEATHPANPEVTFTDSLRYLATNSRWASRDPGDDDWLLRLTREVSTALSLDRVTAFGRKYSPNNEREVSLSRIPADFWLTADFSVFDVMNERTTQQPVHSIRPHGPAYTDIYFDQSQLNRAWPPRSWFASLIRKSPAERRGNVKDWKKRDAELGAIGRKIRDGVAKRLLEKDARLAD